MKNNVDRKRRQSDVPQSFSQEKNVRAGCEVRETTEANDLVKMGAKFVRSIVSFLSNFVISFFVCLS